MTESQQKYINCDNSRIEKIDANTVVIFFNGVSYIMTRKEIKVAIENQKEWLEQLYKALDLLIDKQKIMYTSSTALPSFDNYDIT